MKQLYPITLLLSVLFLAACGQKGPLYLSPPDVAPSSTQTTVR